MPKVEYNNVIYDSKEELDFKHWLDEAFEAKLIYGYRKCVKDIDTFTLIASQNYYKSGDLKKPKHCFRPVKYTPDFVIYGGDWIPYLQKDMGDDNHYIDVKGGFSRHNDGKQFQLIRKMLFLFKGIYAHIVKPDELFLKTWVPELCRRTPKQGKLKKKFANTPTISEYLNNNKL